MNDIEADLLIANAKIKQLEEQLADYHHTSELVNGKMAENQRLRRINENLQEQLAASQHRERAAVEDMKIIVETASECNVCKHRVGVSGCPIRYKECKFEWRGPQEAGKGEAK